MIFSKCILKIKKERRKLDGVVTNVFKNGFNLYSSTTMPRTFLVKKFKKRDAQSTVRTYIAEKSNYEKRGLENDEPKLLQTPYVSCLKKGCDEMKTCLGLKENAEGIIYL